MRTVELDAAPRLAPLLVKAAVTARTRRGGPLPATELVLPDVRPDLARLGEYARVCGFRLGADMPPTYPHILGFPLAVRLMTDSDFPFPLPGLVHVDNTVTQHRPVPVTTPLTLRVRAEDLTETDRGSEFVMRTDAYAEGNLAWHEESRYLRRKRRDGTGSGTKGAHTRSPQDEARPAPSAVWRIADDTGRRYAAVSGDYNPIHLHPLGARLAGFRRPIVHGMWTLARCLGALEGRLPDAFRNEVSFRRPISLPSSVDFTAAQQDGRWQLGVHDTEGRTTYLTGTVRPA